MIQKDLKYIKLYAVIPQTIINICFDFFYLTRTMIYFISQDLKKNSNGLYIVDIENDKNWKCEVLHLTLGYITFVCIYIVDINNI